MVVFRVKFVCVVDLEQAVSYLGEVFGGFIDARIEGLIEFSSILWRILTEQVNLMQIFLQIRVLDGNRRVPKSF